MSLLNSVFGTASGNYSQEEKALTEIQIKKLVSRSQVKTLSQNEEAIVEEALSARCRGDGKISLRQIYEVLTKLKNQNKISSQDRQGLMKVFEEYFK